MSGFNVARNRQQSRERRIAAEAFYDGEHSVKHDPTTCITTWLASQEAEKALAEALEKQHAAFLEQPESFESRQAIAAFLLSALTESVKR